MGVCKKELTQEQVLSIYRDLDAATDYMANVWKVAMQGMRLDSKEYKAICKAGRDVQRLKIHFAGKIEMYKSDLKRSESYGFN